MKITIEIPKWAEKRNISVFAGTEVIALKEVNKKIKLKITPCSKCGKCCEKLKFHHFPIDNGRCVYLKPYGTEQQICSLGFARPFSCCSSIDSKVDECSVRWENET